MQLPRVITVVTLVPALVCATSARATVVSDWNAATLAEVRLSKSLRNGPPMVARALAIAHTCMYDAWAAYDDRAVGTELKGALRRLKWNRTRENKRKAISYAAYMAAVDLFPESKELFDGFMQSLSFSPSDSKTDTSTPAAIG